MNAEPLYLAEYRCGNCGARRTQPPNASALDYCGECNHREWQLHPVVRAVAPAGTSEPSEAAIDAVYLRAFGYTNAPDVRTKVEQFQRASIREQLAAAYAVDFGAAAPPPEEP